MSSIGYVYFVQGPNGLIKIGHTCKHPDDRHAGLEAMSPVPIAKLGVMRGYRELERKLHGIFLPDLHHSEWFHPSEPLLAFIKSRARPWPLRPASGRAEPDDAAAEAEYQLVLAELIDWALEMRVERDMGRPLRLFGRIGPSFDRWLVASESARLPETTRREPEN